jgi:hypothetical protein
MFVFTYIEENMYKTNKLEVTEINDLQITYLCVLCFKFLTFFVMVKTFILKLIIAFMSICGPG